MGSSTPKTTVGYRYYMGMHMILCHGLIDGIREIWAGDKLAWSTASDGATRASINQPNLFGGDMSQGGISGDVDIAYGAAGQSTNDYLVSQLGADIPAYRGLVGVILRGVYVGNSSYLQPWSFLAKRTSILNDGTPQWYQAKADINGDMNPAHIIRECLTNSVWGLGYSSGAIDDDSFAYAADTLYSENFGLSLVWSDDSTIEDFITLILQHIDGTLFQDNRTGLFKLGLTRDDYDVANLDEFDEFIIDDVQDYSRGTYTKMVNQIIIGYTDRETDKYATATVQNIAVISQQGGAVTSNTIDYDGISNADLAAKVAVRELRHATSSLAKATIYGNRHLSTLQVNDVFLLTWPIRGISKMPVRVMRIDYGTSQDGRIKVEVLEDIFKTPVTGFVVPQSTAWVNPVNSPQPSPVRLLVEAPYWTVIKETLSRSLTQTLDALSGILTVGAVKPTSDAYNYELLVQDTSLLPFVSAGNGFWTPSATLTADLPISINSATIQLTGISAGLDEVIVGTYAIIDNELVAVISVNIATSQVTIQRAVLDTVPALHNAGARIWFFESAYSIYLKEYTYNETPGTKVLTITGKGELDSSLAPVDTLTMNKRQIRPYPPANLRINSVSLATTFNGQPTLTWAHRDRTQQTATLITQSAGDIGPEAGTTYTLKIYDQNNVLRRTETGLIGNSYTYTEANERADCGLSPTDPLNTHLRFQFWSVRDGFDSWQKYDMTCNRV